MNRNATHNLLADGPETLPPGERAYFEEHRRRYEQTLRLVPPPALPPGTGKLLDVGALPGHLALLTRTLGYAVWGISDLDAPESFLDRARRHDIRMARADIETERFPHPDDFFDTVLFCEVIEHLHGNPFAALSEIFRVLKPGGTLIMSTPNLASAGKILGLLRGFSYKQPLSSPLQICFPPRLAHTHFREYTIRELVYMLRWQSRCLYRFEPEEVVYSSCWDKPLRSLLRTPGSVSRLLAASFLAAVSRLIPPLRGCLMIRARKPAAAAWVPPDAWSDVSGFHTREHDAPPPDQSRHVLPSPFSWTGNEASVSFQNPLPGAANRLMLRCALLAPDAVPAASVRFFLNNVSSLEISLRPALEYRAVTIPIPPSLSHAPRLTLRIATSGWAPKDWGFPDARTLGIMLAWEPLLLFSEARSKPSALEKLGRRLSGEEASPHA